MQRSWAQTQEAELPEDLRSRIIEIRAEYLRIPIGERLLWGYDYFLRCKTAEYLVTKNRIR